MPTQPVRIVRVEYTDAQHAHLYRLAQAHKLIRLFEAGDDEISDGPVKPDAIDFAAAEGAQ